MRTDYSEGGMRWSFLLLAAAAQLLGSDAFSGNLIGAAGTRRLHPAWSRVSFQKQSRPSMQLQSPGDRKDRKQGVASREFSPILSMILAAGLLFPSAASAAPDWDVETTRTYLDIFLAIFSTLFFIRIPITWYPQLDITKFPQAIVCWPTEPFLKAVRGITPPLFGVDISPIIIYGTLSFVREIFLGQQGLLIMMANKQ